MNQQERMESKMPIFSRRSIESKDSVVSVIVFTTSAAIPAEGAINTEHGIQININSVVKALFPELLDQFQHWAVDKAILAFPEDGNEDSLVSLERFISGHTLLLLDQVEGRGDQVALAFGNASGEPVVLCACGSFEHTPSGFSRFEIKREGDQALIYQLK
jgi:hypothetical protein